jgi:hypothetical protein
MFIYSRVTCVSFFFTRNSKLSILITPLRGQLERAYLCLRTLRYAILSGAERLEIKYDTTLDIEDGGPTKGT